MLPPQPFPAFEQFGNPVRQFHLFALLKKVCRKAYFTSQKGHHLKALKIMNEPYVPKNHELYCRVKAHLCLQVCVSQNNDNEYLSLEDKYKYLKEALWLAKMTTLHDPYGKEYVYFFAGLLYCRYIYDLVVQPSCKPLEIKSIMAQVTDCHPPENTIAGVQQGLCDLVINECRNFIQIGGRIKECELEDFMLSIKKNWGRQPNEVERALLTPKKRRKELKLKQKKAPVRVPAAAELIRSCRRQQKSGLLVVKSECQQRNAECTVSDFHPILPKKNYNPNLIEELNKILQTVIV